MSRQDRICVASVCHAPVEEGDDGYQVDPEAKSPSTSHEDDSRWRERRAAEFIHFERAANRAGDCVKSKYLIIEERRRRRVPPRGEQMYRYLPIPTYIPGNDRG